MKIINNTNSTRPVFSGKTVKTIFQNYTCKEVKTGLNSGFTLVELIIVITILSILATIAFISFKWYTSNSRDGNRLATIKNIESGLELYSLKTSKYPTPENITWTWVIWAETLVYVWEIADNISRNINMSKTPKDPLSNNNYIYWTDTNYSYYQIATVLENWVAYASPSSLVAHFPPQLRGTMGEFIPTTYADSSSYQAYVVWNYTYPLRKWTKLYSLPSLIFTWTGNLELNSTWFVVNKWTNTPYKLNTNQTENTQTIEDVLKIVTWTWWRTLTWITLTNWDTNSWSLAQTFFGTNSIENIDKIWIAYYWVNKYITEIKTSWDTEITPITPTTVNATCWSANWTTVATAPTTNLCLDLSTPTVSWTWPWTWTCIWTGTPKWNDVSCSANKTLVVWEIGTVTYDTTYTYTTKVMPMKRSDNSTYNAIWTTQNMRHPVNSCLTTTWTSTDTWKCSVWNQTNGVVWYDDTNTQTNSYWLYYQHSVAKEVCKLLWTWWDLATDEQFKDLERWLWCTDPSPTWTRNRCWNWYWWFTAGTYGLWYTASSTESVRYMWWVFWTNSTSLPGYRYTDGTFVNRGSYGYRWSATGGASSASSRLLLSSFSTVYLGSNTVARGFSVVCIKN